MAETPELRFVQVMASGEVKISPPFPTTANWPPDHAAACRISFVGRGFLSVQVVPDWPEAVTGKVSAEANPIK